MHSVGVIVKEVVDISIVFSLLSKNVKIKSYRTIISPFVLYGCETWLLTLREERRLRVFENRVLRIIFGPKRDKGTGECRKLHNEELNPLPVQFKSLLPGQEGCVFFSGHLNARTYHHVLLR
jgi:hypothetical protein